MSNRIIKQRVIALASDTVRLKLAEFSLRSLATPSVELIKIAADRVPGRGVASALAMPSGQSREWVSLPLAG